MLMMAVCLIWGYLNDEHFPKKKFKSKSIFESKRIKTKSDKENPELKKEYQ